MKFLSILILLTLLCTLVPQVISVKFENNPPYVPNNPNPANGTINVNINIILNWTGGDPNGDPVTYNIYFGTINPPPQVVVNQTNTTYNPGTLQYETQYYWKIIAWDNQSAYSEGPIWNFITIQEPNNPPNQPSNPSPANGATNVNLNADLSWIGGDPDGDNVTYNVFFGTVNPPITLVSENQTSTSYDPGILNSGTTYYWKIVSYDIFNASNSGPIWNFTTITNGPPYLPSDPRPGNGTTNVDVNTNLKWICGDPDGDTVTYDIYFDKIYPPQKIASNYSDIVYDPGTMDLNTMYYWKIVAWDSNNVSTEGPEWYFTTTDKINRPPNRPVILGTIGILVPEIPYDYNISAADPDGDDVFYYIDWGDGTYEDWFGPNIEGENVTKNHSWPAITRLYQIKVKAKDIYGSESDWGTFFVFIFAWKASNTSKVVKVFLAFMQRFTIIQRILTIIFKINRVLR